MDRLIPMRAVRTTVALAAALLAFAANAAPIRVGTTNSSSDAPLFIA